MPLGFAGDFNSIDLDWAHDIMTIPNELVDEEYWRGTTLTISTEQEICLSVGTKADSGGMGNSGSIMSVEYGVSEITTEILQKPVSPGVNIAQNTRLMYVDTACLLFTASEKKYTIQGRGECPVPEATGPNALLSSYASTFETAHGTYSIAVDSTARIQNGPRIAKTRDNPWEWTIEAGCTIQNPSPSSSNILSPDSTFTALIPSGMVGVYAETQRIAEGKDSRASESWTAVCYYTS